MMLAKLRVSYFLCIKVNVTLFITLPSAGGTPKQEFLTGSIGPDLNLGATSSRFNKLLSVNNNN